MTTKISSVSTKYTPEYITSLKENEIFVFGSNLLGKHIGGAARIAKEKFGAQERVSEGITGQCYAIPTLEARSYKMVCNKQRFTLVVPEGETEMNIY